MSCVGLNRADPVIGKASQAQAPGSRISLVIRGCVVSTVKHACYDPKDSELCLARAKPQETGVEARSRCDVQIHGISWA